MQLNGEVTYQTEEKATARPTNNATSPLDQESTAVPQNRVTSEP